MTRIAHTDLDVFPLALGGNVFGWTADRDESFRILDAFHAGGGNFIDTADSYSAWVAGNSGGESERIIGAWLADRKPDGVTVATKVSQHPQFTGLAAAAAQYATPQGLQILEVLERIGAAHDVSIAATALAWLRAKLTVIAPIASASKLSQVPDLLDGGRVDLTADEVAELDAVSEWTPTDM
ncbi:MAG: aldo/keto reductase [Microbacterium sp.]|uniref:aldo/keto reductase n=1 Tax=Microbacterium sp. TaxID=51671 RepID=UPI0019BB8F53|nr:aldo/keto reductase [Microbacterium sp.]MBD3758807.1 aldo/keto reductase [Microbacterium sp.]